MKCSICGWDTADKVVLRDEWGTIRAIHNGPRTLPAVGSQVKCA